MQQKKFVTNIAFLIILNLLIKPFWPLGIETAVQNAVGNTSYGEYSILFSFSFLLNIILDFGVTQFNNKNIAQNNHLLTKHFSSLFTLKIILGFIYLIITIILGFLMGYDFRLMKLLFILSINQFLISMIAYLRSNLLGLHLFKTDSFVSVADRVIMISICLVMLLKWFGLHIDIMNFVYAQSIGYFLTAAIAFLTVYFKTHHFELKWNWPFSIMILKQSFPFAILVLLMTFYNRLDSVMPIFSRMIKHKENVENIVKLAFILLITPSLMVSVGSFFYSEELTAIINRGAKDSAAEFSVLMFCLTAVSTTYIFGTLLTANGNLKQLNIMAIVGIFINLVLNFILIPHYKAFGSALSSLITQFFTAGIQIYFAYKIFKFKINVKLLLSLSIFLVGVILFNCFGRYATTNWLFNFFISTSCSLIWAFLSGLINIKLILRFIKYR